MIRRRQLFGLAAGSAVLATSLRAQFAAAAAGSSGAAAPIARGMDGRLHRPGSLDLESMLDYTKGVRLQHAKDIRKASQAAFDRLLDREGIDATTPMSIDTLRGLIDKDPAMGLGHRVWLSNQLMMWKMLQSHFHQYSDHYLAEMEAADRAGPGSLEMSPTMSLPDYSRHEIHIQPGGYVGDPFAGHMYHYGTNSFYIVARGHNEQDQIHRGVASRLPLPKDGKVKRILDYGCGIGQMTAAMKERFPDAEVWGIDVGAPMIRYGHLRARGLGYGVNFAQRLAEDTKFPDGYFDLVTSYIAHHEMPAEVTRAVITEARRITRPGGIYYPLDFVSGGVKQVPRALFGRWWDHRWNNEVWSLEYHSLDFSGEIASRGFTQVKDTKPALAGFGHRHFVRDA